MSKLAGLFGWSIDTGYSSAEATPSNCLSQKWQSKPWHWTMTTAVIKFTNKPLKRIYLNSLTRFWMNCMWTWWTSRNSHFQSGFSPVPGFKTGNVQSCPDLENFAKTTKTCIRGRWKVHAQDAERYHLSMMTTFPWCAMAGWCSPSFTKLQFNSCPADRSLPVGEVPGSRWNNMDTRVPTEHCILSERKHIQWSSS